MKSKINSENIKLQPSHFSQKPQNMIMKNNNNNNQRGGSCEKNINSANFRCKSNENFVGGAVQYKAPNYQENSYKYK